MSTTTIELQAVESDELVPPLGRTAANAERRYLVSSSPWRARDVSRCLTLAVAGATGILGSWYGAGGETTLKAQEPWMVASMVALAVFVLGGVSWITAGLREVRHGFRDLAVDKNTVFELASVTAPGDVVDVTPQRVAGPGMTRAHRPDCPLVRGKAVAPVAAKDAARLADCGVCLP
jgi:hypothetical protein